MSYQLKIDEASGYLHVLVSGANSGEVVRRYLHEVAEICGARRCSALLLEENLTGPAMNLAEIYSVVKVAFVDSNSEHPIMNMRFAETVARNRGVNVRAFRTVPEARAWLLER